MNDDSPMEEIFDSPECTVFHDTTDPRYPWILRMVDSEHHYGTREGIVGHLKALAEAERERAATYIARAQRYEMGIRMVNEEGKYYNVRQ